MGEALARHFPSSRYNYLRAAAVPHALPGGPRAPRPLPATRRRPRPPRGAPARARRSGHRGDTHVRADHRTRLGAALLGRAFGGWVVALGLLAAAALVLSGNLVRMSKGEADPGQTTKLAALVMYGVGARCSGGHRSDGGGSRARRRGDRAPASPPPSTGSSAALEKGHLGDHAARAHPHRLVSPFQRLVKSRLDESLTLHTSPPAHATALLGACPLPWVAGG